MTAYTTIDTLKAALVDYAGLGAFKDGTGTLRTRYRRNGVTKYTRAEPGSVEFEAWYEALITGTAAPTVVKLFGGVTPKSLGHAYQLLRETREWKELQPKTRDNQQPAIEAFLNKEVAPGMQWKHAPICELRRANVQKEVDSLSVHQGAMLLTVLHKLADIALNQEPAWMEYDPTLGVKKGKRGLSKWKPWALSSLLKFEAAYAYGTNARTVYELAKWLGVRRSDIATIAWEQYGEELVDGVMVEGFTFIPYKGRKRGKAMFQPMTDELKAALAHVPAEERKGTVLKAAHGGPYIIHSLSRRMLDWTLAIGLAPGHVLHGIRKNMGVDMAAGGATMREGMAGLGHSTTQQYVLYSADYEQKRGAVVASNKVVDFRRKREELLKKAG